MSFIGQGINMFSHVIERSESFTRRCLEASGEFTNFGVYSGTSFIFKTPNFLMLDNEALKIRSYLRNEIHDDRSLFVNKEPYSLDRVDLDRNILVGIKLDGVGTVYVKSTPDAGTMLIVYDYRNFDPQIMERVNSFASKTINTRE